MPFFLFVFYFFFFNDTATTEIYTLSLHDALPISLRKRKAAGQRLPEGRKHGAHPDPVGDRKSTRLNSSHVEISYAVFCLKKELILSGSQNTGGPQGAVGQQHNNQNWGALVGTLSALHSIRALFASGFRMFFFFIKARPPPYPPPFPHGALFSG